MPDGTPPSIAQSPQVIAIPRPTAERLGWPAGTDLLARHPGLRDRSGPVGAIAGPGSGDFKLGKTNPLYSTSGLNATVATYQAASDRRRAI